ncbi:MAG: hypothetical protein RI894_1950 [Bacteroidota bacterium]|jgi:membrane associated rhomboid family serine protease
MNIFDDVKQQYRKGDRVTQLIIINIAVFLLFLVVRLLLLLFGGKEGEQSFQTVLRFFEAPNNLADSLTHFWTPITYMFLHEGIGHLFFNMLSLYWFGSILQDMGGRKLILPIYLLGGLVGWAVFVLSAFAPNLYVGNMALGASAGVMAILAAAATLVPRYELHLLIIGRVELWLVALFLIVVDLASISALNPTNNGGHLMHLGGVVAGWLFIRELQRGRDYAEWFEFHFNNIAAWFQGFGKQKMTATRGGASKSQPKTVFNTPRHSSDDEDHERVLVDAILEKIKRSGIQSLSDKEREMLYKSSKK